MSVDVIPPDFSATKKWLEAGQEWNQGGFVKSVAAHTITPVGTIGTAALDTLAHALAALVKAIVFVPRTVVQVVAYPFGGYDIAPAANLPVILEHLGKTAGNLAMIVVMPLTSLFSCSTALSVLANLQLAKGKEEAPKGFFANLSAQKGFNEKAKYVWGHKKDALHDSTIAIGNAASTAASKLNNKWVGGALALAVAAGAVEHAYNGWYKGETAGGSYTGNTLAGAWNMLPSVSLSSLWPFGGSELSYETLKAAADGAEQALTAAKAATVDTNDQDAVNAHQTSLDALQTAFNIATQAVTEFCSQNPAPTGCPTVT